MVIYRILLDLEVISGPVYISFCSLRTLKFRLFFGRASRSLFIDFQIQFSIFGTSKSWFSPRRYCTNRRFMEIVFNEFQLENEWFFGDVTDPESGNWGPPKT